MPAFRSVALALLTLLALPAQAQDAARPLTVGQPTADSLGADAHVFTLDLDAGQFVYGEADQQTVDVVVTITSPDGEAVGRFDGPARGPEPFQFETEAAGTYRIEVAPFEDETGRYALAVRRAEALATTPEGRVDQMMAPYDAEDRPGAVVAVLRGGAPTFARGYGMANLTHDIPFEPDVRSNIGSTSKQFTAFALTLLAERGEVSLDDDVRDYLPELPDFGQTVTLRHLLTHTSGYREFLNTLALAGRSIGEGAPIDRSEIAEVVQRQPELQNAPGSEWNYNNTGYALAAQVVEKVSGRPFPVFLEEEVFAPLGMTETIVRAHPGDVIAHSAQGYVPAEDGYREARDLGGAMGAGGIYTTAADLAKWAHNLDTRAFGGDVIEQMTTPYVLTTGDTTDYGLGLFLDEHQGLRRIHHGGADVAHRSAFAYYPALGAAVVVLSNNSTLGGSLGDDVAEAFFADQMEEDESEDTPADEAMAEDGDASSDALDAIAGTYNLEGLPIVLEFARDGDVLTVSQNGSPFLPVRALSDSVFAFDASNAEFTFHDVEDGQVERATLYQNGMTIPLARSEAELSADDLAAYAGRYFSEELQTSYTLEVEDGALVLRHPRLDPITLTPTGEDTFGGSFPIAEVAFERGEDGEVVGFAVSNGRTRGVRFERMDGEPAAPTADEGR